jgi:hypothetical protein
MNNSILSKTSDIKLLKIKETTINFLKVINRRKVEIAMLRSLSFREIPHHLKGLRPIVWKILLEYLPKDTSTWMKVIED